MRWLTLLYWMAWFLLGVALLSSGYLYIDALFHLSYKLAVWEAVMILLNTWSTWSLVKAGPPWRINRYRSENRTFRSLQ